MAPGFELQWEIEGSKQLSRVMQNMEVKLKDFRIPFTDASKELVKIFSKDVFETEGSAIGEKWARLSPYTVAQKARLGYSAKPLVRTGRMQRSFKSIIETTQATIYNDTEYFKYHQSNKPRSKLPRRVMMKLAEIQKQIVVKAFQTYFHKVMKKT